MSLAYTKDFLATSTAQMLLGKDGNRKELSIYNLSDTEFVFIGLGNERDVFTSSNSLPLSPGEAYDTTIPPLNAIFIVTNGPSVPILVAYATTAPAYVRGVLGDAEA